MSSFVSLAENAAEDMLAASVRCVLREAAAHFVRQRVLLRHDDEEIFVQEEDLTVAYRAAHRIGTKWHEKLKSNDEHVAANVVAAVLQNGQFLDLSVVDSDLRGRTMEKQTAQTTITPTRNPLGRKPLEKPATHHCNNNNNNASTMPYAALSKLGWRVELSYGATPTETIPQHGNSELQQQQLLERREKETRKDEQINGWWTGIPPKSIQLHPSYTNNNAMEEEWITTQIRYIDEMAYKNATLWHHDTHGTYYWNAIQKAVERNTNRIHLETLRGNRQRKETTPLTMEIVPKSLLLRKDMEHYDTTTESIETPSQEEEEDTTLVSTEESMVVLSQSQRLSSLILDKQQREKNRQPQSSVWKRAERYPATKSENQSTAETNNKRGRQASALGQVSWSWEEDILGDLSQSVKTMLEHTMLHPTTNEECNGSIHTLQGALKMLGTIHLWEEMKISRHDTMNPVPALHKQEDVISDTTTTTPECNKRRKRVYRKAKKERLGPSSFDRNKRDDCSSWSTKRQCSKIVWAERKRPSNVDRLEHENDSHYYMELDVGECVLELTSSSTTDEPFIPREKKKLLAFRSLEISLLEQDDPHKPFGW